MLGIVTGLLVKPEVVRCQMADEAPKEAPAGIGVIPNADFAPAHLNAWLCKIHRCTKRAGVSLVIT